MDTPVTIDRDMILWRGTLMLRTSAIKLRDHFRQIRDWFAPTAHAYADQLDQALTATHEQEAA